MPTTSHDETRQQVPHRRRSSRRTVNATVMFVEQHNDTLQHENDDGWRSQVVVVPTTSATVVVVRPSPIESSSSSSATTTIALVVDSSRNIIVLFYVAIFVLSVVGNVLVILTLVQNKRMRTVTNVLLLNLSISDLLLSVFCMPFTLVGAVRRQFIFGPIMCKLIPYLQGLSVSIGVWTLRYFAICQPLRSRRWQTLSHVYKMIAGVWLLSTVWMLPIAFVSRLLPLRNGGKFKCREKWPSGVYEKAYNVFLDIVLLVVPLVVMVVAYCLISKTLYRGMRHEEECAKTTTTTAAASDCDEYYEDGDDSVDVAKNACGRTTTTTLKNGECNSTSDDDESGRTTATATATPPSRPPPQSSASSSRRRLRRRVIRRTNVDKTLKAKRRVIRMLFVVVLEFFVCWTPLYVLNTAALFAPGLVYGVLGQRTISLVQLLAYVSSCCNPITYCFMHKRFRQSFLTVFGCRYRFRRWQRQRRRHATLGDGTTNDGSFCLSRQSTMRTEIVVCSNRNDEMASFARRPPTSLASTTVVDQSTL